MLFPVQSQVFFESGGSAASLVHTSQIPKLYTNLCSDPASILFVMDDPALTELTTPQATAFLRSFMASSPEPPVPPPSSYAQTLVTYSQYPIQLLAWRIDRPSRIILYTGASAPTPSQLDPLAFQPHTLQKTMLEERSKRLAPSVIHQCSESTKISKAGVSSDLIRHSLAHYAKHTLSPFQEKIANASGTTRGKTKQRPVIAQSHVLEESITCFIHPPKPGNHSEVSLNGSLSWNKGHIDSRYSPVKP
jgi:hypothetical protein